MWESSAEERLLRQLTSLDRPQKKEELTTDSEGVPDLLADSMHLLTIRLVRDFVRSLLRESRKYDRKAQNLESSCHQDMQRFIVFVCCRVIGGQTRDLTEKDRRCLQQVVGFEIPPASFEAIGKELRDQEAERLDQRIPELLRL